MAATYAYNGDGLRVKKLAMDGAGGQTVDHRYTWDVGAALPVILQETANGQPTYYVHGLDLIASVQGSTATYYLTDGLGSTTQRTDGAGAVTGAYTYDAAGNETLRRIQSRGADTFRSGGLSANQIIPLPH